MDPHYFSILNQLAAAELVAAQYRVELGIDPGLTLSSAFFHLERSVAVKPDYGRTFFHQARGHYLAARYSLGEARDPGPFVEKGLWALREAQRRDPDCVDCRVLGAQLHLAAAAWARRRPRIALVSIRRALAEAKRAVRMYPYAEAHQELARVYLKLSEALPPRPALSAITDGLAQVELGLALSPSMAEAYALRGALSVGRASVQDDSASRLAAAKTARDAFARAFETNALLQREYDQLAREADRILESAPGLSN